MLDIDTSLPISNVSVKVDSGSILKSNYQGIVELPLRFDSVCFSHLQYYKEKLYMAEVQDTIYLTPQENSLPEAKVPDLENTSDGKITEYLIAVLEVKAPVGNISPNDVIIKSTIYEPDESPSSAEIRIGITADKVAHYSKALVPTDKTVEDIIQSLEKAFDSYQQDYQHQFDEWFQEIKDSLGVLSNDQVMKLSLLVGEIYASDYVSGKYPAVVDDGLWLSISDSGELPEVDINFGYASLPFSPNGKARETTVNDKKILYSDQLLYSVGDYVWHGDPLKLYVCTTNIEVAEDWNDDHWEEVTT